MDRLVQITQRYYNPGQPGSFGGLPIGERYLKGNLKDFLIRQDRLDTALIVGKYLLKGYTTGGSRRYAVLGAT